jgi:hypothetical protein
MPIAPTTFDAAFSNLGIALKTSHSWDNYSQYNAALGDVRDACAISQAFPMRA